MTLVDVNVLLDVARLMFRYRHGGVPLYKKQASYAVSWIFIKQVMIARANAGKQKNVIPAQAGTSRDMGTVRPG